MYRPAAKKGKRILKTPKTITCSSPECTVQLTTWDSSRRNCSYACGRRKSALAYARRQYELARSTTNSVVRFKRTVDRTYKAKDLIDWSPEQIERRWDKLCKEAVS